MRLDEFDPSSNTDDIGTGGGFGGGDGGGLNLLFSLLPMVLGTRLGCGTIALIAVIGMIFLSVGGGNLTGIGMPGSGSASSTGVAATGGACASDAQLFACKVLRSTEITWGQIFSANGQGYTPPRLEFYHDHNRSGCGAAQAAMGPFYCPVDEKIYLDTDFFNELATRFGAGGDFAKAYVVAHEVGHHVQKLLGIADKVQAYQQQADQSSGNLEQVKMELQADCFAGVWARNARTPRTNQPVLQPGDIEEGIKAAHAIGDDTLQRSAGQTPVPDSFTHGTSAQRMHWLKEGYDTGDVNACNTFARGAVTEE